MARVFIYEGRELPDPDTNMTPDDVRESLKTLLPDLANAEVVKSTRGDDTLYEFKKRVGTKGGG